MAIYYTGVGSRLTPPNICLEMTAMAESFARSGLVLRSGAAEGADSSFERGAGDLKEIWIPWTGFNGSVSHHLPSIKAFAIASLIHPSWDMLSAGAQKLHARNVHQVLGADLKTPSAFVVCWTPNGNMFGGTATALRLACEHDIPIFNLGARK